MTARAKSSMRSPPRPCDESGQARDNGADGKPLADHAGRSKEHLFFPYAEEGGQLMCDNREVFDPVFSGAGVCAPAVGEERARLPSGPALVVEDVGGLDFIAV